MDIFKGCRRAVKKRIFLRVGCLFQRVASFFLRVGCLFWGVVSVFAGLGIFRCLVKVQKGSLFFRDGVRVMHYSPSFRYCPWPY